MRILQFILASLLTMTACADTPSGSPVTQETSTMSTISRSGHRIAELSPEIRASLAAKLDPKTYEITQRSGTEAPFCGTLLDNKKDGVYVCVVCGLPLFSSEHKFTSGTGWPSFFQEFDPQHVAKIEDRSHGMLRTEISCVRCTAHLGHVFPDGPPPTGQRHCLNSASLQFIENGTPLPESSRPIETETAYFAGGCFWGIEHYLQKGPGVVDAVSGYMQGDDSQADYQSVCGGQTGHAETVKVVFDPKTISYRQLVDAFLRMHDPTQLNRQGPDVGTQYRSGIWTVGDEQSRIAKEAVQTLNASGRLSAPAVTEITPAKTFHSAETYHQDYIARTGRACNVVNPWPNPEVSPSIR